MGARTDSLVQARHNRETGTEVGVYDLGAPRAPVDPGGPEDPRWLTACETHGFNVAHYTRADAVSHAAQPSGWCLGCQNVLALRRGEPPKGDCGDPLEWTGTAWICRSCERTYDPDVETFVPAPPNPKCSTCSGPCSWAEDCWICDRCGDEWYPDPGTVYALAVPRENT
jgi:hypothetical protein